MAFAVSSRAGSTRNQYVWPVHDVPLPKKKPASVQPAAPPRLAAEAIAPAPTLPMEHQRNSRPSPPPTNAADNAVQGNAVGKGDASAATQMTRQRPVIPSLAKPPQKPERPRPRGSLADQLASISAQSETMITGLKQAVSKDGGELGTPKLLVYCNHMVVGRAESQFSSAVSFFHDKVSYAFQHARERRIDMLMYYKDMCNVSINDRQSTLSFRINKPLQHFSKDYDSNNMAHVLTIPFSKADFAGFKAKVLPLIEALAISKAEKGLSQKSITSGR